MAVNAKGPVPVREGLYPAHDEAKRGAIREYRLGGGKTVTAARRRMREQIRGGRIHAIARRELGPRDIRQRGMPRFSAHCDVTDVLDPMIGVSTG